MRSGNLEEDPPPVKDASLEFPSGNSWVMCTAACSAKLCGDWWFVWAQTGENFSVNSSWRPRVRSVSEVHWNRVNGENLGSMLSVLMAPFICKYTGKTLNYILQVDELYDM